MGAVMVYSGRKVVVGYAGTHGGCSVGHYGLETVKPILYGWASLHLMTKKLI